MPDLCMSEFEGTLWDEIFCDDDQEVPHHGFEQCNDHFLWGNSNNNTRHEVSSISSDTENGSVSGYIDLGTMCNQRSAMLEKGSLHHKQSGVFSSSGCDFIEETSGVTFDITRSSSYEFKNSETNSKGSEFSGNDTYLDGSIQVENNSFNHPLEDITPTENCLNLFECTDSTGFFCDDWPVIGNFEDVDKMFRRCDSTFGIGVSKEDKLDCVSSGDDKGEYGDLMKSGFKFPCPETKAVENIPENNDFSKSYFANDSSLTSVSTGFKYSSCMLEKSDSAVSFVNGSDMADGKEGFVPRDMDIGFSDTVQPRVTINGHSKTNSAEVINEHKMQFKQLNQSDDISLKGASFCQLQLVMDWLDLKTKLCLRDGLYRLARGAEHRRNHANLSDICGDEKFYSGSCTVEGINKCINIINMETNTNPIDRSIAHLLFHRPSGSPAILAHDF